MPHPFVDGEAHVVGATRLQRLYHLATEGDVHDGIGVTVESPDGHVRERAGLLRVAAAADGRDGCEAFGMHRRQRPRPEAAHTVARQVNARRVDGVDRHDVVEERRQRGDLLRPDRPIGTLR